MPPGAVVCAVGDVHGRLDLLEPALAALFRIRQEAWDAGKSFAAVLLGDYIDRGPDSRGVLARLAALADSEEGRGFVFLRGNHEQEVLDLIDGKAMTRRWLEFGGVETLNSYYHRSGESFVMDPDADLGDLITRVVPSDHIRFLRRTQLFVVYGGYAFVHAGLNPEASLDGQTTDDMLWRRDLSDETPRHGLTVVHGHSIFQRPVVGRWQIGIDTGAFATGCLSILRLEGASRTLIRVSRSGPDARAVAVGWEEDEVAADGPVAATTDHPDGPAVADAVRPPPDPAEASRRVLRLGLLLVLVLAMGLVALMILRPGRGVPRVAGTSDMRLETLQLVPGHDPPAVDGAAGKVRARSGPGQAMATPPTRPAPRPAVEVGAFATEADAAAFQADLRNQMPADFTGRVFETREGGAGASSLVRSFVSGFATADEARAFCARLGAQGRACWLAEVDEAGHPLGRGRAPH